jgi:hypothetical protein
MPRLRAACQTSASRLRRERSSSKFIRPRPSHRKRGGAEFRYERRRPTRRVPGSREARANRVLHYSQRRLPRAVKDSVYVVISRAGVFVGLAIVSTLTWVLGSTGSPNASGLFVILFVVGGAVGDAIAPRSGLMFVIPTVLIVLLYLLPALRISRAAVAATDLSKRRTFTLWCWGYPFLFSVLMVFPQVKL